MTCSLDDEPLDTRRVPRQRGDDVAPEVGRRIRPGSSAGEPVRRELHVDRHDVRTGRRERRVVQGRDRDVEVRIGGHLAVLRCVERALEVVDAWAICTRPRRLAGSLTPVNVGQRAQREIDFRGGSRAAVVSDANEEAGVELDGVDHAEERALRIGVRDDRARGDLPPVVEHDSRGAPVANDDARDRRRGADFGACLGRRLGHGTRQRARSALDCHAAAARRGIGGRVQEQGRAGAGRPWPLGNAENAAGGDGGLEEIVREPLGDEIRGGHRHPSQTAGTSRRARAPESAGPSSAAPTTRRLPGPVERWRRRLEQLAEETAQPLEDVRRTRGYLAASASENARMASAVRRSSVEKASARPSSDSVDEPRIGRDELHSAGREPHVAHDRRPERPDRMRERRAPEPRRDSSVTAPPPTIGRRSSTSGFSPAFAR